MKPSSEFKPQVHQPFQTFLILLALLLPLPIACAAPGDLDRTFDPGSSINGTVSTMTVQHDGSILIGGSFTSVPGGLRSGIARLNADGSLDDSFLSAMAGPADSSLPVNINDIAIQADGKLLIAGYFTAFNGIAKTNIARLNSDGSLDDSFNVPVGSGDYIRLWLQPDGKILVMGAWGAINGSTLVRCNADGTLDNSFHADFVKTWQHVDELVVQSDGKLVVAGPAPATGVVQIARLNPDGSVDASFNVSLAASGSFDIRSLAVQSDDKILMGGWFQSVNGVARSCLCRLNADGSLDTNFLNGTYGVDNEVLGIAVQDDGQILIGGWFNSVNGTPCPCLARLNSDGSLDASFANGATTLGGFNLGIYALAVQANGQILIRGSFTMVNGVGLPGFARLNADGSLDTSFLSNRSGPNFIVNRLAVQRDNQVIISGLFTVVDGVPQANLARLHADGALDTSFAVQLPGMSLRSESLPVLCVGLQSDDKILISGIFTNVNGASRSYLARLNPDGNLDASFNPSIGGDYYSYNCRISQFGQQKDGKLLICGQFTVVNGVARTNLARLNPDGSLDASFQSPFGTSDYPAAFAVLPDGRILVIGSSSPSPGLMQKHLVCLQPNGSLDTSFLNGQSGAAGSIYSILVQPDGKILIGGAFTSVNGVTKTGLARLNADGSLDATYADGLAGAANGVNSFILQGDGKILASLSFGSVTDSLYPTNLAQINADGTLDRNYLAGQSGPGSAPFQIVAQSDGRVVICGSFTTVNQVPRSYVARLMGEYAAPSVAALPPGATAEAQGTFRLTARASGGPPLSCQWYFNGTNCLAGCTNCFLTLNGIALSNLGAYTVVISNLSGSITSTPMSLNVIPWVDRRPVPALNLTGDSGSVLHLQYADSLDSSSTWSPLDTVTLTTVPQPYFDLTSPLPPQRFYRALWGDPIAVPILDLNMVPAISLTGNPGDQLRVDTINQFGPTDAWTTLATVTLTNTAQLYFDTSAPHQPTRLYRLVPVP